MVFAKMHYFGNICHFFSRVLQPPSFVRQWKELQHLEQLQHQR